MNQHHLDIVLPCYNPIEGWSNNIVRNYQALAASLPNTTLHLILVNDGAARSISPTDIDYLKQHIPYFRYIHYPQNQGKGYALRQGVSHSEHDLCIYTDVDFPYELGSFLKIYNALRTGEYDVVVGARSEDYYEKVPMLRVWISKLLKFCIRTFLNTPVTDTQCGLKGFNKAGKAIFLKTTINRYLFDLEFIYLIGRKSQLSISPIEVQLKDGIVFSNMPFRILFREGMSFLKILFSK